MDHLVGECLQPAEEGGTIIVEVEMASRKVVPLEATGGQVPPGIEVIRVGVGIEGPSDAGSEENDGDAAPVCAHAICATGISLRASCDPCAVTLSTRRSSASGPVRRMNQSP